MDEARPHPAKRIRKVVFLHINGLARLLCLTLILLCPLNHVMAATSENTQSPITNIELPDVSGLPLIELPGIDNTSDLLVFISSGDGGWANLDRQNGQEMQSSSLAVIGLDTGAYYGQAHTAAASSADLDAILEHYLAAWKKQRVLLIGYSRGADVMPFMVNPLPAATVDKLALIALLGPGTHTNFKFLPSDATSAQKDNGPPTVSAIVQMKGKPVICIYGSEEETSACPELPAGVAKIIELPGGHHFNGDYKGIADRILAELKSRS